MISNATGILTVSSRRLMSMTSSTQARAQAQSQAQILELDIDYDRIMLNEINGMDAYDRHLSAYLALCIEEKLTKISHHKNKCSECADVLLAANDRMNDGLLAMKTTAFEPAKQPLFSTLKIVVFANAVMKAISSQSDQGNDFDTVCKTIFNYLDIDDLYSTERFEQHEQQESITYTHKEDFVIRVVQTYMTFKSEKIGRKIADEARGELIRHKNKDAVHLAGQ